jgi:hypothetical protein
LTRPCGPVVESRIEEHGKRTGDALAQWLERCGGRSSGAVSPHRAPPDDASVIRRGSASSRLQRSSFPRRPFLHRFGLRGFDGSCRRGRPASRAVAASCAHRPIAPIRCATIA